MTDSCHEQTRILYQASRGDGQAFAALYREHAQAIYSLVLRMTGQHASAEDTLQDTFLRAFQQAGSFRGESSIRHWLKRIAVNAAIDRMRQDRRLVALDQIEEQASPTGRNDDLNEVLGLLTRLSPSARSVVWLHQMEGYSHPEIAELFGHSQSWSKSVLARSLDLLRTSLADSGTKSDPTQRS